jgi:hypothetical protein
VYRIKVNCLMGKFIVFDDQEGGDERIESEVIDEEVDNSALSLLSCGMRWLEHENRLCEEKDGARIKKRVGREEREGRVEEDAGPYESYQ